MKTTLIYLARPIDREEDPKSLYGATLDALRDALREVNRFSPVSIFCPGLAFSLTGPMDQDGARNLVSINSRALEVADVMVLVYVPGVESWGCPQEVMVASDMGIPIIVKTPMDYPYDKIPNYLKAFVDQGDFVGTWSSVAKAVLHASKRPQSDVSSDDAIRQIVPDFNQQYQDLWNSTREVNQQIKKVLRDAGLTS